MSRSDPSAAETSTVGGGAGARSWARGSARHGNVLRNGLSVTTARGHCGLSMERAKAR